MLKLQQVHYGRYEFIDCSSGMEILAIVASQYIFMMMIMILHSTTNKPINVNT